MSKHPTAGLFFVAYPVVLTAVGYYTRRALWIRTRSTAFVGIRLEPAPAPDSLTDPVLVVEFSVEAPTFAEAANVAEGEADRQGRGPVEFVNVKLRAL
jgi:hypothetical protein